MSEQASEELAVQARRQVSEAADARARYLAELEDATAGRGDAGVAERRANRPADPALVLLTDNSAPSDKRVEVLQRLGGSLSRRPRYLEALLRIVRDRDDDPSVRTAALRVLGSAAFQVARFTPFEQEHDAALHDLLTDPVPTLRETAVTVLCQRHDPVAQQALLAGLRGESPLPVDRERAIALLAEDDHLDNLPLLQEMYASSSETARQDAVRYMASYPEAQPTIEAVLRNKGETPRVRQQGAAALRSLDPRRFESVAKDIAIDTADDPQVRTALLTALRHLGAPEAVESDREFRDRVGAMSEDESAPDVAQVARSLLEERPGT